jgi:hypothetical protein
MLKIAKIISSLSFLLTTMLLTLTVSFGILTVSIDTTIGTVSIPKDTVITIIN